MDTISILLRQFDNRALIRAHEIYQVLKPAPKNPQRTAIEAISREEFPLPTLKIIGRRYVRIVDLAALIDSKNNNYNNHDNAPPRRRPGRPKKTEGGAA